MKKEILELVEQVLSISLRMLEISEDIFDEDNRRIDDDAEIDSTN